MGEYYLPIRVLLRPQQMILRGRGAGRDVVFHPIPGVQGQNLVISLFPFLAVLDVSNLLQRLVRHLHKGVLSVNRVVIPLQVDGFHNALPNLDGRRAFPVLVPVWISYRRKFCDIDA